MTYDISVTWDGHELHDLFVIEEIVRPAMGSSKLTTATVGFADGVRFVGTRREAPQVSLKLFAQGSDAREVRAAWERLAEWLHVDEPKRLVFGDEESYYRLAIPTGNVDVSHAAHNSERASVSFLVPDGRLWSPAEQVAGASGTSSATVRNLGSAPAKPTITVPAATGNLVFRLGDDGPTMSLSVGSEPKSVVIDCASRSCSIDGTPALIRLDEDFFELPPRAASKITRASGSGDFTVSLRPSRWC